MEPIGAKTCRLSRTRCSSIFGSAGYAKATHISTEGDPAPESGVDPQRTIRIDRGTAPKRPIPDVELRTSVMSPRFHSTLV